MKWSFRTKQTSWKKKQKTQKREQVHFEVENVVQSDVIGS